MPNKFFKKGLVVGIIALFIGMSISSITGTENKSIIQTSSDIYQNRLFDIINISVFEAWELLNDTSNGIQIPIDMRNESDWAEGFIDTPYPENPIHISWENLGIEKFITEYSGKEIVPYFKAKGHYRFLIFLYLLLSNNFTGTIYLWPDGIDTWIEARLPVRNNTAPEAPNVKGKVMIHEPGPYNYKFKATDSERDYVRYFIDWGDGTSEWTDYNGSGEEIIVSHTWNEVVTAMVSSKANDTYGALGPEGYLEWSKVDNKEIEPYKNNVFYWFLERYLLLNQLLQRFTFL